VQDASQQLKHASSGSGACRHTFLARHIWYAASKHTGACNRALQLTNVGIKQGFKPCVSSKQPRQPDRGHLLCALVCANAFCHVEPASPWEKTVQHDELPVSGLKLHGGCTPTLLIRRAVPDGTSTTQVI